MLRVSGCCWTGACKESEGRRELREGRKDEEGEKEERMNPRPDPMWQISNRPTMASRRFGMKDDEW
jgi:hypothetical protein